VKSVEKTNYYFMVGEEERGRKSLDAKNM